jgi:glycosyltransferase involved in cell wall biosynthesis
MTSLLVFCPDYRSANPYQTLLYEHAGRELYPRPGSIAEALALQRQRRLGARVIFHLHWEDGIYRNEPTEAAAWQAAQAFLADLEALLDAGGHLVWTLHNEQPHDGRYLPVHKALCEKLGLLADVVHVHSLAASAFARSRLRIDPGRLALIHHGSYTTLYPRLATPAARSRAALGLAKARRVLLLFGRLGRYKGGLELLSAFNRIDDQGLWLIVAGKQVDPLHDALDRLSPSARRRVVVLDRFLGHDELPPLFHASDMVVMPYQASLTSGTAMLALSQGRPVLAPAFKSMTELLDDGVDALLYEPGSPSALQKAILRLVGLKDAQLAQMQGAARAKSELYDWRQSGLLLSGVYARLLGTLRPQRSLVGVLAGQGRDPAPAGDATPAPSDEPRTATAGAAARSRLVEA